MRFCIATVIYGTRIDIRPSSLKCKRRMQILLAETTVVRYKTSDGKKILGILILIFPTSVELCQNKSIRCWIMQLHFTTLTEVCGAFAPLINDKQITLCQTYRIYSSRKSHLQKYWGWPVLCVEVLNHINQILLKSESTVISFCSLHCEI